ncbi:MAG: hypothetical protein ACRD3G_07060 [Vicinamibacterales bacterium]
MPVRTIVVALIAVLVAAPAAAAQDHLAVGVEDDARGADVLGAFADSLKLLMIEHAIRVGFREKTRRELGGNFWHDYRRSVRMPGQWTDTDSWWVNYIGHPIHGAAAGYPWLDHEPNAPKTFSRGSEYWASRGRAMAWSAGYSLQFEIGPLSEASIGNVGMRPETTGWVDHVITPVGAFGFLVAEDAVDRYVVQWIEKRIRHPVFRVVCGSPRTRFGHCPILPAASFPGIVPIGHCGGADCSV